MPKVIQVIISDDLRGRGIADNPYYRAIQLFTLDGRLICEHGPTTHEPNPNWPDIKPVVSYETLASLR